MRIVLKCTVSLVTVSLMMAAGVAVGQAVKVAYIGDQGLGTRARAVLRLIKNEGAAIVLHQGDLDYVNSPHKWVEMITAELGADFPYLASVGNHDKGKWREYRQVLDTRLARTKDVQCRGEMGVKAVCEFQGLYFVLSGVGTLGRGHEEFIREKLAESSAPWKICSWHKNQRKMQVGGKSDETGWDVYEICREHGAMIATGHEHSYSRTHLLSNFKRQTVASKSATLVLEPGKSFAFVSGLGGLEARRQKLSGDWWASIYTADQQAQSGALFCEYFIGGDAKKAECYFKNTDGQIVDEFKLESRL